MTSSTPASLTPIQVAVTLESVPLFADCTAEQVVRLAEIAQQRRLPGGERIYARGDAADALYVVVEGEVELRGGSRRDAAAETNGGGAPGGRRRVGRAETFGVVAILADRLRDEEAWTAAPSLVLALDADDFFDLLAHNIEIVKSLFRSLLRRGEVAAGREPARSAARPRPAHDAIAAPTRGERSDRRSGLPLVELEAGGAEGAA